MRSLEEAGIEVRYQEFEDCFHAFDIIAAESDISNAALDFTFNSYADFYDRFVGQPGSPGAI